jgi:hypothetical protein
LICCVIRNQVPIRGIVSPICEWLSFLDSLASTAAIAIDLARVNELLRAANANHRLLRSRSKLPELSKVEWDMLKLLVDGHMNPSNSIRG